MANYHLGKSFERYTTQWGDYIRVFRNCPFRHGWIMELQVPQSEWQDKKYDKYR